MANSPYDGYGMPAVDFGILGNLPQVYDKARKDAVRERTLAELGTGGPIDYAEASRRLIAAGLPEEGISLAKLAEAKAQHAQSASQFGITSAEAARHNRATEGLTAEGQNKPITISETDPLTGERATGVFYPKTGKVEWPRREQAPQPTAPGQAQAPAGQPRPVGIPQQALSPQPLENAGGGLSGGLPPQAQPAPTQPAPVSGRNDAVYNALSAPTQRLVDDVYSGKQSTAGMPPTLKFRTEQQVRKVYSDWTPPASMSPEQVTTDGIRLANGDLSVLQNRGRGQQGADDINKLRQAATSYVMQKYGFSPEEAAQWTTTKLLEQKQQQAMATAAGRTAGTRETNLQLILNATEAAIPAALEKAELVWRNGFIPLNRMISASGQVLVDNPAERNFAIANLQLAEHWARAMNPLGVMRESDRDLALKYLTTAASPDGYRQAVRQVQTQITRERDAVAKGTSIFSEARKQLEAKGGNSPGGGASTTPPAAPGVTDWQTYFGAK